MFNEIADLFACVCVIRVLSPSIIGGRTQNTDNTHTRKQISYFIEHASCDDAGLYTCSGYNPHIQDQRRDTADIQVNVRCFPRGAQPVSNISTASQNEAVYFNVTLVAYPIPRDEDYIWRKQLGDTSWLPLNTDNRVQISTGNLQTGITIHSIHQSDYGSYSLTVSNNVGRDYYQEFKLIPHDPPGQPENISVIVENPEVAIYWVPGFDGGFEQSFVIQTSTDLHSWYNMLFELARSGSSKHYFTALKGFDFDTTYYIRMFAYNMLGRSDYTPDPEIRFLIKSGSADIDSDGSQASIIGPVVGLSVGCLVFMIIGIVIGIWFGRRNKKSGDSIEVDLRSPGSRVEGDAGTAADTNIYEQAISTNILENAYSDLKHENIDPTAQFKPVKPSHIYVNLRQ